MCTIQYSHRLQVKKGVDRELNSSQHICNQAMHMHPTDERGELLHTYSDRSLESWTALQ